MSLATIVVLPSTRERLTECEAVIERGMSSFIEVGNALARIRDESLYGHIHGTFEEYCRARWGMSRRYAYNVIDAASVCAIAHTENEAQARALLPLKDDPDLLREVWDAITESGEKPTAALIRKVLGTEKKEEPPTDREMWDALQVFRRGYEKVSDVERAVATIPRERRASTATWVRRLSQVLARIAYELEQSDKRVLLDMEEINDVAERALANEDLSYQGQPG